MTDPKRLLDGGTDLEVHLLASALDDAPPKGLDRRVRSALGIAGVAVGAGAASSTAAAATSKTVPLAVSFGVAKWVGIVAVGAGAAAGAAVVHHEARLHAIATELPPPPTAPAAPATPAHPVAIAPSIPSSRAIDPLPSSTASPASPPTPLAAEDRAAVAQSPLARSAPAAAVPADTTAALVAELALLDEAHKALDASDTERALATLDRHDLEFPHGDLAPESLALRIEAYARRHDATKVRELGQSFLSKYPAHPQSQRVRSMMEGSAR